MEESSESKRRVSETPADQRLDSWKEIATYLDRDVRTVQRWEKEEELPVRRHIHHTQVSVYAYPSEIDAWLGKRSTTLEPGWLRFFSEHKKIGAGVASGLTLLFLAGLLTWRELGPSPDLTVLDFQQRDWVLIADFENRTGESVLDDVLESALRREISNSQFVNVVPRERIEDTLELMRKPLDTGIDPEVAREICLRDGGIKALLTGRVEKLDSTYLLSVELVDPSTGQTIAATSEEATGQGEVLTTLSRLSRWSRETLGEKLTDIRESEEQLERVTTPSLRALRLLTKAGALIISGRSGQGPAEKLLKQAVDIDPEFASAHIFLAHAIRNQREPAEDRVNEYMKHAEQAFRLAGTTGDRERYFIQGSYFGMKGEHEKAIQAYEALLSLHPDHYWATVNLTVQLRTVGQDQRALTYQLRLADLRPNDFASNSRAVMRLLLDNNWIRAKPYIERARKLITTEMIQADIDVTRIMLFPAHEAWLGGDPQAALVEVAEVSQTLRSAGISLKAVPKLGHLYGALGQRQLAREWRTKGLEWRDRHWTLALIAHDEGDHEAMKNHLKQYLEATKVSGGDETALTAILLARAGLIAESEKIVLELERRGVTSQSAQVEMARGVLKLSQGNTSEGIAILEGTLPLVGIRYKFKGLRNPGRSLHPPGELGGGHSTPQFGTKAYPWSVWSCVSMVKIPLAVGKPLPRSWSRGGSAKNRG